MKRLFAIILLFCVAVGMTACTQNFRRNIKTVKSNWTGGLNRTVTVYDYNGGEIQSWTGKFDVTESEDEVYFDINGKRVIIHGGIVINEED